MEIKELKKEIDGLTRVDKSLNGFKESWLKKIQSNTNKEQLFLQELDEGDKKEINGYLEAYQKIFNQLSYAKFTQEKLSSLAQCLIELKLTSLNGDRNKPKMLVNKFIKDDFLGLKQLVDELNQFDFNLKNLNLIYEKTNQLLLQKMPLEYSVALLDGAHKNHLNSLFLTSQKQKKLLKGLGKEFISLAKDMKKKGKL